MSETLAVKSDLKTEVKCISVEALAAMRNAGRDVVVIDVRSPKEYEDGHIEGAVNVPVEEVEAGVFVPKGKSVVTACGKGGGRSDRAAAALSRMGVEDVHALCGGTNAWLSAVGSGS
ncbi:MAG: rhodanese-like domain-containing protein [Gemmatimonadota bacterium]|nr:rhodanese-like domain-containing protein [Gemmatimonadota bacterium]